MSEIHKFFVKNESLHGKFAEGCACCLKIVLQNQNVFSFIFHSRTWQQFITFYSALFITDIFLSPPDTTLALPYQRETRLLKPNAPRETPF